MLNLSKYWNLWKAILNLEMFLIFFILLIFENICKWVQWKERLFRSKKHNTLNNLFLACSSNLKKGIPVILQSVHMDFILKHSHEKINVNSEELNPQHQKKLNKLPKYYKKCWHAWLTTGPLTLAWLKSFSDNAMGFVHFGTRSNSIFLLFVIIKDGFPFLS